MTFRTAHRRISPRTKRRYQAFKNFLRRALGSSSRQDLNIDSTIAVNVSDLKHEIVGLEQKLNKVPRHCCKYSQSSQGSEVFGTAEKQESETDILSVITKSSTPQVIKNVESDFVYRNINNKCSIRGDSDCTLNVTRHNIHKSKNMNDIHSYCSTTQSKNNNKKSKSNSRDMFKGNTHTTHRKNDFFENTTNSCHSLIASSIVKHDLTYNGCQGDYRTLEKYRKPRTSAISKRTRDKTNYEHHGKNKVSQSFNEDFVEKPINNKKHKRGVDEDFIADLINRQYKCVRYSGKRESSLSQFSAPVCRDYEFMFKDTIREGTDLCSCCHNTNFCNNPSNCLDDLKSICDARLYSSNRHLKPKQIKHQHRVDVYDSTLYDLVPVKEKSSPKSRRKFVEESLKNYDIYKEVPPSPRTQRPRLNLKAQYSTEVEDDAVNAKQPYVTRLTNKEKIHCRSAETLVSELDNNIPIKNLYCKDKNKPKTPVIIHKDAQIQQEMETCNLMHPDEEIVKRTDEKRNIYVNNDQVVDKTDQTLAEIKDILQNFLQEIKKDTPPVTHWDKSESVSTEKHLDHSQNTSNKINCTNSSNNYSVDQCFAQPHCITNLQNPCYYPIFPIYPNNVQTSCVVPSATFTCQACLSSKNDSCYDSQCSNYNKPQTDKKCKATNATNVIETEEMIKEIYKAVAQKSKTAHEEHQKENQNNPITEIKPLVSRSVGDSIKNIKQDANVGTPRQKLYSKSCEAICSQTASETGEYRGGIAKTGYSDTILEKASLEATESSDSLTDEYTYESTTEEKPKESKFTKVLKSFGLFKKKIKEEEIEELSESESSTIVNKKKPPFRQDVAHYMVHGQEYFNAPPLPPDARYYYNSPHREQYSPPPNFDPRFCGYPGQIPNQPCDMYNYDNPRTSNSPVQQRYSPARSPTRSPVPSPGPAPFSMSYESQYSQNMQHQVPLCLKEVEVKSIATQSETKKKSFFEKLSKMRQLKDSRTNSDEPRNCSTQTAQENKFNWKSLQPNIPKKIDAVNFTINTQKELAAGDLNLKKAMMKKLFYKRNPFSPRNLIVRTLLGKDKSSFGEPPKMVRPRTFF